MGENTKIEWATHTFNPWWGCTALSPACDFCYAEAWAKRTGQPELWQGERKRMSAAYWRQPLKWNAAAKVAGERPRVFCASMADVFDNQVPPEWRRDLWELIAGTPSLDWLLLTKRPQNIVKMLPGAPGHQQPWDAKRPHAPLWPVWPWPNVWLGTTAEDQERYEQRWPHLSKVDAVVRFISYEPALGPLTIGLEPDGILPDWLIAGGESGGKARPPHPQWFRSVRDDCDRLGIKLLFKQWGEWAPGHATNLVYRVGKKRAGRLLDGRTWDEFPKPNAA